MMISRLSMLIGLVAVLAGCTTISTTATTQAVIPLATQTISSQFVTPPPGTPMQSTASLLAPLGLSGRLVFTNAPNDVEQLDLSTGVLSTVLSPDGFVMSSSVSPDGTQIALAYQESLSFSTDSVVPAYGYTNIYLMPAQGGEPTLYLKGDSDDEILLLPFWSPDGKYLYFIHFHPDVNEYNLERVAYPDTEPETVVKNVLFSQLSTDGSKLVYVGIDPSTSRTSLHIADSTGANDITLVDATMFYTMDVAIFTPDNQSVIFSAVEGAPSSFKPSADVHARVLFTDRLPRGALHGNLPSDLWQVSIEGGAPKQLTDLREFSIHPAFSPDGQHLAMRAVGGIYLMNPDGTIQVHLTEGGGFGTMEWIP